MVGVSLTKAQGRQLSKEPFAESLDVAESAALQLFYYYLARDRAAFRTARESSAESVFYKCQQAAPSTRKRPRKGEDQFVFPRHDGALPITSTAGAIRAVLGLSCHRRSATEVGSGALITPYF